MHIALNIGKSVMSLIEYSINLFGLVCFGLVGFYGSETIVGYLMPNPFLYI